MPTVVERPVSRQLWVQNNVFLKGLISTHNEVESVLSGGKKKCVLLSVSSPAALICACWKAQLIISSLGLTLSPVFLSFGKCEIMHVLFVVSQSVRLSLLSLGQATDVFHIEVLLN